MMAQSFLVKTWGIGGITHYYDNEGNLTLYKCDAKVFHDARKAFEVVHELRRHGEIASVVLREF